MKRYRFLLVFLLFCVWISTPATAEIFQAIRYVGMDTTSADTAWMYDENFERFPDLPGRRTSYESFEGKSLWLLAAENHVVRRAKDGRMEEMENTPVYAKLNHHLVFAYTKGGSLDNIQTPLGSGSEMGAFEFPAPYAYKMEGGFLAIATWHWHNLGGVPRDEEVYMKLVFTFDDQDQGYRDTNATWITGPVEFCVPPGEFIHESRQFRMPERRRPVVVIPHIHDHSYMAELVNDGKVVMTFEPELVDNYSYHISHGGCPNTFWHRHEGHIKVNTLRQWTMDPNNDIIFERGSSLWSRSYYNNPHSNVVDGMDILVTFWEAVP